MVSHASASCESHPSLNISEYDLEVVSTHSKSSDEKGSESAVDESEL